MIKKKSASFLSLHILNFHSLRNQIFLWGLLSIYNYSELRNFSFGEQNFKDMRASEPSCVNKVTSWIFSFRFIGKHTSIITQISLMGEN